MSHSSYFPPLVANASGVEKDAAAEQDDSTEPSELLSQLPDAPTGEPLDIEDVEQPSTKKQKTTESEDEFVVVEKDDAADAKPSSGL